MNVRFLLSLIGLSFLAASGTRAAEKPNIVLIMVDDMGYSDIGCYGGEIPTPNIDALAANGLRFRQFYNTARCCPTRASLLTGLTPHQAGIGEMSEDGDEVSEVDSKKGAALPPSYQRHLGTDTVTLAEALKPSGYHTYMVGKWHVGTDGMEKWPMQRGFERYYGILAGACSYLKPTGGRGIWDGNTHIEITDPDYYTTDAFTDHAIQFVNEQQDDKPFFLYVAYNAPHWPLQAKEKDIKQFDGMFTEGWDALRAARHKRQIDMGLFDETSELSPRDQINRPWDAMSEQDHEQLLRRMRVYAAMVSCVDQNVGKLIETLKAKGQFENTLILFLSDNGACAEPPRDLGGGKVSEINDPSQAWRPSYGSGWANMSDTPFRKWKEKMYEGGMCTPLIAHWPAGITTQAGKFTSAVGTLPDIMPTLLDIAGGTYPTKHNGIDIKPAIGLSLTPIFRTGERTGRDWLYWEHTKSRAVRHGDMKAVWDRDEKQWELYNLQTDRTELHDLAREQADVLKDMVEHWNAWAKNEGVDFSHEYRPKQIVGQPE